MYGDLQIRIMTREVERERLAYRDSLLRRAGWYRLQAEERERRRWERAASADRWTRLALAILSRPPLPLASITGLWRGPLRGGRGQDRPPTRAPQPM